jgi:hypothetical protein
MQLSAAATLALLLLSPLSVLTRPAASAPALPPPRGTVVRVSTEAQLQAAVRNLASNTTILIAPGTYRLSATLSIAGPLRQISLRGSGDRDDVVLVGSGMRPSADALSFGIWIGGDVSDVQIANLTVRELARHAVIVNPGVQRPHLYNVRLADAGQQLLKSNPGESGGVDGGVVEYSVFEYTAAAPTFYTNGIDVHRGAGWVIRDNLFRNIVSADGALAGPAVLMWNRSRDTIAERNQFVNCARGISFGLEEAASDHAGGVIRNNVIVRRGDERGDVGIHIADSPGTRVLNNTVFLSGTYATPIEYRFSGTREIVIRNNLVDGAIAARDGAAGIVSDNVTTAAAGWFRDVATGDLRLTGLAVAAIDRGVALRDVTDDWAGISRPQGRGYDVGAFESAVRIRR